MRQSQLFGKTLHDAPHHEVSANAKLLVRAGFVDKLMAGVYTYLPLGLRVVQKIEEIIRKEMVKAGGQELLMPVLHPKENWVITGRWNLYDTLFRFASYYSQVELALGPTHEEVITPLVGKSSLSYKDLPLYLFQIQTKFRDEKRVKSGILRGREFMMKDLYSFHADEKDMQDYYEKMKRHYHSIFNRVGIGEKTYFTFASGGTFSKYSHEFQTVTEAGEDTIFICDKCRMAVNSEIISEQGICPGCGCKNLMEKKAVEVGNIFPLKTRYSDPFGLTYIDKNGGRRPVIMGCYGIGLGRLMGSIVEIHHDERGIIWPGEVAPYKVHLVEIVSRSKDLKVKKAAERLYGELLAKGVEVLYDDRDDKTAGEKFADADLVGIPWRVVVSEKSREKKAVEVKRRDENGVKLMSAKKFLKLVSHP